LLEKVKVYSAQQAGHRGLKLHLPAVFCRAAGIGPKDKAEILVGVDPPMIIIRRDDGTPEGTIYKYKLEIEEE
jgi:hypothetical protein